MQNIEVKYPVFRIGSKVEVTSNEKGFKHSWYKCKIVNAPKSKNTTTSVKKKNFYWVEYENIVEEDDHSKQLREYVHVSCLRPLPPTSSACIKLFDKNDVVEADYRDGRWTGVVLDVFNHGLNYLVAFESPYEEIQFHRDALRPSLNWIGGNRWLPKPKKNALRCPQDGDEMVGALQRKSIIAEVLAMEETPSPAKRLKQATSDDAEGMQSLGGENVVQALTAPPLLQLSSSEANTNCNRKMEASGRDSGCSLLLSPNNIQVNCKKNDGMSYTKKRNPTKKEVQKLLNSLQHGEEPGESGDMHEIAIEQRTTSDAAGPHCRSPTKEVQVTEIIDDFNDIEEVIDEQVEEIPSNVVELPWASAVSSGDCQSMAIVLCPDPALSESSNPHPATLGVDSQSNTSQGWPFTKRSVMWKLLESMEVFERIPQMPHFSPLKEHEENLREMTAISMMMRFTYEVERITKGFPDNLQSTRSIHDSLDNLKELESHGFNTTSLQVYLKELLEKEEREKELQQELKEVEDRIIMSQTENIEAKRMLNEAVEQMKCLQAVIKHSETVINHKEKQVAELESMKGIISGELHHILLTKKRHPFEW